MKRLTREERKRRSRRILILFTYGCLLLLLLIWLAGLLSMTTTAGPVPDEIHYYWTDDTGSGVEDNHVGSHQESLNMVGRSTTVWLVMP